MVKQNETDPIRYNDGKRSRNRSSSSDNFVNRRTNYPESAADELIGSLANAYENKRARQVTEWERLRTQNGPANNSIVYVRH